MADKQWFQSETRQWEVRDALSDSLFQSTWW